MKFIIVSLMVLLSSSMATDVFPIENQSVLLQEGKAFPSFMLKPIKGRHLSSKKLFRKSQKDSLQAVVFSYWSISCIPCRAEMKALQAWQIKKPKVKLIFINVDEKKSKELVFKFALEYLNEDLVLLDSYQKSAERAKVCKNNSCILPSLYMTDAAGKIIYNQQGNENSEELIQSLEKSL
jgi:thiol-disulfide isomerase/thioredoxin